MSDPSQVHIGSNIWKHHWKITRKRLFHVGSKSSLFPPWLTRWCWNVIKWIRPKCLFDAETSSSGYDLNVCFHIATSSNGYNNVNQNVGSKSSPHWKEHLKASSGYNINVCFHTATSSSWYVHDVEFPSKINSDVNNVDQIRNLAVILIQQVVHQVDMTEFWIIKLIEFRYDLVEIQDAFLPSWDLRQVPSTSIAPYGRKSVWQTIIHCSGLL